MNPGHTLVCPHCDAQLVLRPGQPTDISGPCPRCGSWITREPTSGTGSRAPATGSAIRHRRRRPQSRIAPDSIIDHRLAEQRETARSARVLAWFLFAACACAFVAWLLQKWVARA